MTITKIIQDQRRRINADYQSSLADLDAMQEWLYKNVPNGNVAVGETAFHEGLAPCRIMAFDPETCTICLVPLEKVVDLGSGPGEPHEFYIGE